MKHIKQDSDLHFNHNVMICKISYKITMINVSWETTSSSTASVKHFVTLSKQRQILILMAVERHKKFIAYGFCDAIEKVLDDLLIKMMMTIETLITMYFLGETFTVI